MSFIHSHCFPLKNTFFPDFLLLLFWFTYIFFCVLIRPTTIWITKAVWVVSVESVNRFCLKIRKHKSCEQIDSFTSVKNLSNKIVLLNFNNNKNNEMSSTIENGQKPIDNCFVCKKLSSLKCSNCVKVYYCSAQHQKQDWKRHKQQCHPFEVR